MPYKTGSWGKQALERSRRRNRYFIEYVAKHKKERDARAKVFYAIKTGKLSKKPCRDCGRTDDIEAHHSDYDKPLEVIWLCPLHHRLEHRKAR